MNPWRSLRGLPRPVYVLAGAMLVNRVGSMVVVLLALYLTRETGMTVAFAGTLVTIYGAMQLVVSPIVGRLCDRFGARRMVILILLLSGVALLLFPLVRSPEGLVAATVVLGFVSEGFRPANMTLVADLAGPEHRRMAFVLLRLSTNLGMAIGPAIGGFLATIWFPAIFIVDGVTTVLAGLVVMLAIPGPRRADAEPERAAEEASSDESETETAEPKPAVQSTRWTITDRRLLYFLAAELGVVVVFFQLFASMPLYVVHHLGLTEREFGLVFTVNTLLILAVEVPLNAATSRWALRWSMALGALLVAIGFGATGLATGLWTFLVTVLVWSFGEMIGFPAVAAYVAEIAPEGQTGSYMGWLNMLFGVGFTLGPWLGVTVLERIGSDVLWGGVFVVGMVSAIMLAFVRSPAPGADGGSPPKEPREEPPPSSRPLVA